MTPERIEPIKLAAFTREELVKLIRKQEAALEETQHQLHDQDEALIAANGLIEDLQIQLAEAQQTIAQQRQALEFYAKPDHWELPEFGRGHSRITSDRGSKARELLCRSDDHHEG